MQLRGIKGNKKVKSPKFHKGTQVRLGHPPSNRSERRAAAKLEKKARNKL
jgi:hypothetical protein